MNKNIAIVLVLVLAMCGCGKSGTQSSRVATMEDLNQALGIMSMSRTHQPETVSDLTNFPTLRGKTLPEAPTGKKLMIDRTRNQVVLVDE